MVKISRREVVALVAIASIAFGLRLLLAVTQGVNLDEGNYIVDASNISSGLIPFRDYLSREPIVPYLTALLFRLTGPGLVNARMVNVIGGAIASLLVAAVARRLAGSLAALFSGLSYAVWPYAVSWGSIVKLEPIASTLSVGAILLVMEGISNQKTWLICAAGALLSIGVMTRRSEVAIFLGLATLLVSRGITRKNRKRTSLAFLGSFGMSLSLILAPFMILTSGQWILSSLGAGGGIQANVQDLYVKARVVSTMLSMMGAISLLLSGLFFYQLRRIARKWGSALSMTITTLTVTFFAFGSSITAYGFGVLWYPGVWNFLVVAGLLVGEFVLFIHFENGGVTTPLPSMAIIAMPTAFLAILYAMYGFSVGLFVDYLNDFTPILCVFAGVAFAAIVLPLARNHELHSLHRAGFICALTIMMVLPALAISPINPFNDPYSNGLSPYNLYERTYPPALVTAVGNYLHQHDPLKEPVLTADTIFPASEGLPTVLNMAYPMWYVPNTQVTDPIGYRPFAYDPYNLMPSVSTIVNASSSVQIVVVGYRTRLLFAAQPLLDRYVKIYFARSATFGQAGTINQVILMERRAVVPLSDYRQTFSQTYCDNCFSAVAGTWNLTTNSLASSSGSNVDSRSLVLLNHNTTYYGIIQLTLDVSGEGGFVFDFNGPQNYAYVRLIESPDFSGIQVIRYDNHTEELVSQLSENIGNSAYTLKVIYFSDELDIFLNNVHALRAELNIQNSSILGLMENYGASFYRLSYSADATSILFDPANYG